LMPSRKTKKMDFVLKKTFLPSATPLTLLTFFPPLSRSLVYLLAFFAFQPSLCIIHSFIIIINWPRQPSTIKLFSLPPQ
jgi:hypothetical protein